MDLVTFTEEILHGKIHFLCSESSFVSSHSLPLLVNTKGGDLRNKNDTKCDVG